MRDSVDEYYESVRPVLKILYRIRRCLCRTTEVAVIEFEEEEEEQAAVEGLTEEIRSHHPATHLSRMSRSFLESGHSTGLIEPPSSRSVILSSSMTVRLPPISAEQPYSPIWRMLPKLIRRVPAKL